MNALEFLEARQALGLTQEALAAELGLTPPVVAAIERGERQAPKAAVRQLIWRAALARREAVLAASGLPECATLLQLQDAFAESANGGRDKLIAAGEALSEHAGGCAVCQARDGYAASHAPPLPDPPLPAWMRVAARLKRAVDQLLGKLPGVMRPPPGEAGEGRRFAVFTAAAFSLLAIGIGVLAAISRLASRGWGSGWWREPLAIVALTPVGYFVGFYLAGSVFDATRRVRHQLMGYVIRGAGAAAAQHLTRYSFHEYPHHATALCIRYAAAGRCPAIDVWKTAQWTERRAPRPRAVIGEDRRSTGSGHAWEDAPR
jgi:transcriptional regulator with XRE-family HTH domain